MKGTSVSLVDLTNALGRLAQSDTPRKRRNARRAFQKECSEVLADALAEYPALRPDGTAIAPRKRKGAFCPHCRIPFASMKNLLQHLAVKHRMQMRFDYGIYHCPCGKSYDKKGMVRHLAAYGKDLGVHFAAAVLKERSLSNGKP